MSENRIITRHGTAFKNGVLTCMARVRTESGSIAEEADISAIVVDVYDSHSATPTDPVYSGTLIVADVITMLMNDNRWDADGLGFNFVYTLPAEAFPGVTKKSNVVFTFTTTPGNTLFLVYTLNVVDPILV